MELSNGCICCTLREDLLLEVNALAREGRFDYLVIESTGIGEPMQARAQAQHARFERSWPLFQKGAWETCLGC